MSQAQTDPVGDGRWRTRKCQSTSWEENLSSFWVFWLHWEHGDTKRLGCFPFAGLVVLGECKLSPLKRAWHMNASIGEDTPAVVYD